MDDPVYADLGEALDMLLGATTILADAILSGDDHQAAETARRMIQD